MKFKCSKNILQQKNCCISIRCIWYIQSDIEFKDSHNSFRTVMIYHYEAPPCGPIRVYFENGPFVPSVDHFDLLKVHFRLSAVQYKVAFGQF